MNETLNITKRKIRAKSSDSDESQSSSPIAKKPKEIDVFSPNHEEPEGIVDSSLASNMTEEINIKLDAILKTLSKLEEDYSSRFDRIESHLDKMNKTVEGMQTSLGNVTQEVTRIDEEMKTMRDTINNVESSLSLAHEQIEGMKKNFDKHSANYKAEIKSLKAENRKLTDQTIYQDVYQRRENLRFYGIPEEGDSENCKEVLYKFFQIHLQMSSARSIEFQRVHRIGKPQASGAPRTIIARFLRYPDREEVMSRRKMLAESEGLGMGPDLPKNVVDIRKKLIPEQIKAREEGKTAFFSRAEPHKLYIEGELFN